MIIACDFDGTLVHSAWPEIGELVPTALETLRQWHHAGHHIIIWTCRTGKELEACEQWLIANGVPYDAINCNLPERVAFYGGSGTRKVSADLYIDDRAPSDPVELWRMARERVTQMCVEPP